MHSSLCLLWRVGISEPEKDLVLPSPKESHSWSSFSSFLSSPSSSSSCFCKSLIFLGHSCVWRWQLYGKGDRPGIIIHIEQIRKLKGREDKAPASELLSAILGTEDVGREGVTCWAKPLGHHPAWSSQRPHVVVAVFLRSVSQETGVQRHQITFPKVILFIGGKTRVWTWVPYLQVRMAPWNAACLMPPPWPHTSHNEPASSRALCPQPTPSLEGRSLAQPWRIRKGSESHSVVSNSLWPYGLCSPWNSAGQNTRGGSLSLLQGIFPTQGLNPGLLHCRQILNQLSHKGSPIILEWVAYPFSSGSSRPRDWTGVSCTAGGFLPTELPGKPH